MGRILSTMPGLTSLGLRVEGLGFRVWGSFLFRLSRFLLQESWLQTQTLHLGAEFGVKGLNLWDP